MAPPQPEPVIDLNKPANYLAAEAEAFVKWHAGQLTWAQASRDRRIQLDAAPALVRAFPTWNDRSVFAHIGPTS
jgi:hypothetical protein